MSRLLLFTAEDEQEARQRKGYFEYVLITDRDDWDNDRLQEEYAEPRFTLHAIFDLEEVMGNADMLPLERTLAANY